ncbi:protein yellow-like [Schistocerca gregaria]|uniref:protein yellow-like n=1 Tax=Schistocerca gregaria TaxID=7010 RepID=UPI00211E78BD|nr:protein yellow-like [Schistocerca gregaria]
MRWACLLLGVLAATHAADLEQLYEWNFLPFRLPHGFPRDAYVPENNVFTGLEVGWNRVFVAIPRLRNGVAATLAVLPKVTHPAHGPAAPPLDAYPSWAWHSTASRPNCSTLVSVYRARADRCDRLWVLDSGLMDSLGTFTRACPPKLVVFDLRTDAPVRSVTFPQDVLRPSSLLTNLVIDDEGSRSCDDVFVYMSDSAAPGLVVYDAGRDSAWRVSQSYMWPHPDRSAFQVAGESFTLMDGVLGLALSPPQPQPQPQLHPLAGHGQPASGSRLLYFQPMAETRLFSVPTSALRGGPLRELEELPVSVVGHKSSQSAVLHVDQRDGAVWISPVTEAAVASWQPATDTATVVAYSPDLIQFSSELILAPRDDYSVWMLSSRFQKFFRRTYNPHEINMRILRIRLAPAVGPYFGPGLLNNTLVFDGF